jgi:hypothetical protein
MRIEGFTPEGIQRPSSKHSLADGPNQPSPEIRSLLFLSRLEGPSSKQSVSYSVCGCVPELIHPTTSFGVECKELS